MCRALVLALVLTFSLFLTGCQREEALPSAAPPAQEGKTSTGPSPSSAPAPAESPVTDSMPLLRQPIVLQRFELPTEAFTVWRTFADRQPTLLLLSNDPFLLPVPEPLRQTVAALASTGGREEIAGHSIAQPAPLLFPGMAVDVALRQRWFGSIAWAIPLRDPDQALSQEVLHRQFSDTGLADVEELRTLKVTGEHNVSATLRGLPLIAATLPLLPALPGPLVVHIDLSYFQPLYKNEISTPLLGIIQQTLATLRQMNLQVLAVTFSYGNRDGRTALDVRFLGELLADLLAQPEALDQPLADHWQQQAGALYLANFFQKEEIRNLHLAQEQNLPETAWVKFNLYRSAAEHKEGTLALDYLAKAVDIDRVFALEYLGLSQIAYEKKRPDQALRMLKLADAAFPGDPQVSTQMAQLTNELGDRRGAAEMVRKLQKEDWSPVYFPEMPAYLEGFRNFLETEGDWSN